MNEEREKSVVEKVNQIVEDKNLSFYIEHNDFLRGNLTVNEEIGDLMRDEEIDLVDAANCISKNSVWSARFYIGDRHEIVYASSFDLVMKKILEVLEKKS